MRDNERRALYESILDDPAASHGDRLRADERLAELDQRQRASTGEVQAPLSPEQQMAELESWAAAAAAAIAVARGPQFIEPPVEADEVRELLNLALQVNERLETLLAERGSGASAADTPATSTPRAGVFPPINLNGLR